MSQFNSESNDDLRQRIAQINEIIEHLKNWIERDSCMPQVLIDGAVSLIEKAEIEKKMLMDK